MMVLSPKVRTVSGSWPLGRTTSTLMSLRSSGTTVTRATASLISTVAAWAAAAQSAVVAASSSSCKRIAFSPSGVPMPAS